jgi:hypothetical protein
MEDLNKLRTAIVALLREYAEYPPSNGDVDVELVVDESQDHYELIYAGWSGYSRIHGSVAHIDIRDGKVWIQYDGTEEGIANRLVKAGIPRDRIVLAFKHPSMRPHTDFAVA